jgi:hypothetical protein
VLLESLDSAGSRSVGLTHNQFNILRLDASSVNLKVSATLPKKKKKNSEKEYVRAIEMKTYLLLWLCLLRLFSSRACSGRSSSGSSASLGTDQLRHFFGCTSASCSCQNAACTRQEAGTYHLQQRPGSSHPWRQKDPQP